MGAEWCVLGIGFVALLVAFLYSLRFIQPKGSDEDSE